LHPPRAGVGEFEDITWNFLVHPRRIGHDEAANVKWRIPKPNTGETR
jgi:hypothetical protein